MTDIPFDQAAAGGNAAPTRRDIGIKRRYRAERRFRLYGLVAIGIGIFFLAALLFTVIRGGYTAFWQTSINLPITFDAAVIDPQGKRDSDPNVLAAANYPLLARDALAAKLGIDVKAPSSREDLRLLSGMISQGAPLTVDRDRDKNPVVALREIADETIAPEDLKEDLIHSLQKYTEVDEPEPEAVPMIASGESSGGDDSDVVLDRMTEEELLKGLEGLAPPEEVPEDDAE